MRIANRLSTALLLLVAAVAQAQEVVPLGTNSGQQNQPYPEKQYFSNVWHTDVVSNVTQPSLTVFKPAAGTANGVGVVVCPGGGFMALSITSEGTEVAKWLSARGLTAFVLKYRLAHTGEDATAEFGAIFQDRAKFRQMVAPVIPLSIADGMAAVVYVRQHASEWGLDPGKIGIVGFSAGGTVTTGTAFHFRPEGRPAFVAPIYPAASGFKDETVPTDAPPMFIAAATDDNLGLAPDSVNLYEQWRKAGKSVELHMYSKGGHGFGMRKQGFPSDHWIDRFGDWLISLGYMK